MFLPDINFWLALAFDAHALHAAAKSWFGGLQGKICFFCRFTQQGFLRLANNPRALPGEAVSMPEAWRLYDECLSDFRVAYAAEPAGIEASWRAFASSTDFAPHHWSDAYLAAFAVAGELEIVTFDQGFARFPLPKITILNSASLE